MEEGREVLKFFANNYLGLEDAVISDTVNHASIIEGIRLCNAQRFHYVNCDLAELEAKLKGNGGIHPDFDVINSGLLGKVILNWNHL